MAPSICVRMNNMARRLGGELQPRSLDLGHAAASDDTGDHNQRVVPSPRKSGTWVVARNLHLQWTCPSALPNCLLLEKNTRSAARGSVLDSRDITIVINTKRPACDRFQAQQMMEGNEIR